MMESQREAKPLLHMVFIKKVMMESQREAKPLFLYPSPSPLKERGIKGVRLLPSR